jgi:hypothetical protein
MASKNTTDQNNTAAKDPAEWVTGDEPMTGPQESYLNTLAHEAGERIDGEMTKSEASEKIEELQARTGRGSPARRPRGKKATNRKGG